MEEIRKVNKTEKRKEARKIFLWAMLGFLVLTSMCMALTQNFEYSTVIGITGYFFMILSQQIELLRKDVSRQRNNLFGGSNK